MAGAVKAAGKVVLLCAAGIGASACNGHDSDFFPYTMTGLEVHVHDNVERRNYYGGFIEANYLSRKEALGQCADLASDAASLPIGCETGASCAVPSRRRQSARPRYGRTKNTAEEARP